jgi:hypothetical protein
MTCDPSAVVKRKQLVRVLLLTIGGGDVANEYDPTVMAVTVHECSNDSCYSTTCVR